MFADDQIGMIPAYFAKTAGGGCVPFIVTLMLVDRDNKARLPPAVEQSIDRTLAITSREGVATSSVWADTALPTTVPQHMARAMKMPDAIVLFRCQTPELAEQLMTFLSENYQLSLVKELEGSGESCA